METSAPLSILQDRKITYIITDPQLRVVEVVDNAGIFPANGCHTLLGSSLIELVPELIGSEPVLADILAGEIPRFELRWVNYDARDGQTIFLTLVNLPYRDADGRITGLIQLMQDVTEDGQVQQQLAQNRNELQLLQAKITRQNQDLAAANAELQRLNEIKSNFISMAAHELNTPLSSIVGYVEMLLDDVYGQLHDRQREPLATVQRSSKRLAAIVNDMLAATRIQAERIELVLQPIDLTGLTESVMAELKHQSDSKGQDLTLNTQTNLPFALVDETRTLQIMGNLVSNAVKYTPDGGNISINLSVAEEEGFLHMAVVDNGVGISAEDQTGLFNQFFRAESASLTGAGGTGLGLYIAHSLVELQGGRIWLESKLNQGSAFHVTFPVAGRRSGD